MSKALVQLAIHSDTPVFVSHLPGYGLRTSLTAEAAAENIPLKMVDLQSYGDILVNDVNMNKLMSSFVWNFIKDISFTLDKNNKGEVPPNILILDGFDLMPKEKQADFFSFVNENLKLTNTSLILPVVNLDNIEESVKKQGVVYIAPEVKENLKNSVGQLHFEPSGSINYDFEDFDSYTKLNGGTDMGAALKFAIEDLSENKGSDAQYSNVQFGKMDKLSKEDEFLIGPPGQGKTSSQKIGSPKEVALKNIEAVNEKFKFVSIVAGETFIEDMTEIKSPNKGVGPK
jgi:hypothetical protein